MTRGEGSSGLDATPAEDLARRADAARGTERFDALAARAGVRPRELVRRAAAWSHGGVAGLAVIDEPAWRAPATEMAAARGALAELLPAGTTLRARDNRVTADGRLQVRLDRRGRWWPFAKVGGHWELAGPAVGSVTELDLDDLV
ncbi:MAG: hypothetical protein U5R31_05055 [Acidimicrobiia bacterium]|nr:hypothetical protein [Acidimicrobiia bacterium]